MPGMKPAFALSLDQNGITLLHRTSQGFSVVGAADPEAADLSERLGMLRTTALGLAPQGLSTKIILPESQILYIDVQAPGPDRGTRRAQIARALEGRTPYPVSDLVYDWSGTGAVVQVAVVARVTLDEAEAFAEDYRFAPVSFVAVPPDGRFGGEPYFGPTSRAGDHLPAGERLDRDQDPVRLLAASVTAGAIAEVADAAPQDDKAAGGGPEAAGDEEAVSEDEAPFVIVLGDDPETSGEVGRALAPAEDAEAAQHGEADAEADEIVAPGTDSGIAVADVPSPRPEPEAERETTAEVLDGTADDAPADMLDLAATDTLADGPETDVSEDTDSVAAIAPDPRAPDAGHPPGDNGSSATDTAEAGLTTLATDQTTDAAAEDPADDAASPPDTSLATDTTAGSIPEPTEETPTDPATVDAAADESIDAPADAAPPAFFTRRQRREAARAAADQIADDADDGTAAAPIIPHDTPPAPAWVTAPVLSVAAAGMPDAPDSPAPSVAARLLARPPERVTERVIDRPIIAERAAPRPTRAAAEPVRRGPGPTILSRLLARLPSRDATTGSIARPAKAAPGPRPGAAALGAGRASVARSPRYMGAALTLALLIFMAAVALWATLFDVGTPQVAATDDAAQTADTAPVADTGTGTIAAPDAIAVGDVTPPEADEAAAATSDPAAAADAGPAEPAPAAVAEAPADPAPPAAPAQQATAAPAPSGRVLPVPDTLRDYATEGVLNIAPAAALLPEPDAAGAPAPGPVDPDPVFGADAALPGTDALASDLAPGAVAEPVPYDQAVRYDSEGMIEATPEGVAAPGGFTLIAGKPARLPPVRPADLVPATAVIVPGTLPADPAAGPNPLAGKRPQGRPAGIAPEDNTALQPEPAILVARPLNPALAAVQPRARPLVAAVSVAAVPAAQGPAAQAGPLAPPVDARHAALAPRARSVAAVAAATDRQSTADAVAAAAAAALSAETAAASAPGVSTATRFAVASSRRPSSKPSRFAQSVEAALAVAVAEPVAQAEPVAEPVAQPDVQAAAEPAPVELDEPEPQNAAPDIPTRASVAKQATIRNALDMGDVSLIGVYGSSSNRRALVRMSSGRFVKVEVGDRLDGGKVAAIGDTQLTYVKNGRSIVLKMIRDS
jgi:hypothetical protein